MGCKAMAALNTHNLRLAYKIRTYLLCKLFQLLLVKIMYNHACFMPIQIRDSEIYIVC